MSKYANLAMSLMAACTFDSTNQATGDDGSVADARSDGSVILDAAVLGGQDAPSSDAKDKEPGACTGGMLARPTFSSSSMTFATTRPKAVLAW